MRLSARTAVTVNDGTRQPQNSIGHGTAKATTIDAHGPPPVRPDNEAEPLQLAGVHASASLDTYSAPPDDDLRCPLPAINPYTGPPTTIATSSTRSPTYMDELNNQATAAKAKAKIAKS